MTSESEFRRELEELKYLRAQVSCHTEKQSPVEIEIAPIQTFQPIQKPSKKSFKLLQPASPANPLIDQQITIVKPTVWIDCISRESKRVFVHDKWIIARIALPSTPLAGLHELLPQ